MSSTPLFDSIARRTEGPSSTPARSAGSVRARQAPAAPATVAASTSAVPTSPISSPIETGSSVHVPAALIAAIDEIPARVTSAATELAVAPEQLVLVEAVADAITRAVVDAVVTELERIARDGVVRS